MVCFCSLELDENIEEDRSKILAGMDLISAGIGKIIISFFL